MPKTDKEVLSEIDDLFGFILRVQNRYKPEVVSTGEVRTGEGRKGVLLIRGDDSWARVFEVRDGSLTPVDNVDNARTVLVFNSPQVFLNICQELLAGYPSAFARARARGDVKVEGEYAVRDAAIFNRLLSKIGQILNQYNVKIGG